MKQISQQRAMALAALRQFLFAQLGKSIMFIQRYYLECLFHASYMVADDTSKQAVIIDPQRDIDHYVQDAQDKGYEIKYVFLTHFHADFISGHIELRDRVGAEIVMERLAEAEFAHRAMGDGR